MLSDLFKAFLARYTKAGRFNPMEQVQGLLVTSIMIDERVLGEEPFALVEANLDFVSRCLSSALLVPGEFPREALLSYQVDCYLGEVSNGGHGQFAYNSRMKPSTLALVEEGLTAIGARDFIEIFRAFLGLIASPEIARITMETGGFQGTPDEIRHLDERFFALNGTDRVIERNARWLRALPILAPMKLECLNQEWDAVVSRNKLYAARREQVDADRQAALAAYRAQRHAERAARNAGRLKQ